MSSRLCRGIKKKICRRVFKRLWFPCCRCNKKNESKAHLEPKTLLHAPESQPEYQCTAKIRIWKQCTAYTVDDVTICRYVDLASQVDFTGKQKGLRWCQPSAIPWHPLHSETCKARCSLGSPHTQTSLEDHVFELFCDAMDDSICVKPTKVLLSPVVTILNFLLRLNAIHGCTAGLHRGGNCSSLPGTCSTYSCI